MGVDSATGDASYAQPRIQSIAAERRVSPATRTPSALSGMCPVQSVRHVPGLYQMLSLMTSFPSVPRHPLHSRVRSHVQGFQASGGGTRWRELAYLMMAFLGSSLGGAGVYAELNACPVPGRFNPMSEQKGALAVACTCSKPMVLNVLGHLFERQVSCLIQ